MKIQKVTYEEARLNFFKELRRRQEQRNEYMLKSAALDDMSPQIKHAFKSQVAETLRYYDDVVAMLEKEITERSAG